MDISGRYVTNQREAGSIMRRLVFSRHCHERLFDRFIAQISKIIRVRSSKFGEMNLYYCPRSDCVNRKKRVYKIKNATFSIVCFKLPIITSIALKQPDELY